MRACTFMSERVLYICASAYRKNRRSESKPIQEVRQVKKLGLHAPNDLQVYGYIKCKPGQISKRLVGINQHANGRRSSSKSS